jgi:heme A synthase
MTLNRFAKFAWFVVVYNIGVVLWGAFVRATGSGAGCGNHWPSCNGVVIPRQPEVETMIEFFHRATSGLALIFVAVMLVWALRAYPRGSSVRRMAGLSSFFIITEALVGASLVLFGWVGDDDSIARAVSISIHLVNTFLLLGFLTLTAWYASGGQPFTFKGRGLVGAALLGGLVGMIILGVTGAITALGDTLFPAGSLVEAVREDFSPTAHFLIRLRVIHPLFAILLGTYLGVVGGVLRLSSPEPRVQRFALGLVVLFVIQLFAGLINLLLLAPVWMQIIHLLLADLVWINLVLLTAVTLAGGGAEARVEVPRPVQAGRSS